MRVPPWVVCVVHGVFLSSRVTGACPVTTDLIMRVNVRTTTTYIAPAACAVGAVHMSCCMRFKAMLTLTILLALLHVCVVRTVCMCPSRYMRCTCCMRCLLFAALCVLYVSHLLSYTTRAWWRKPPYAPPLHHGKTTALSCVIDNTWVQKG